MKYYFNNSENDVLCYPLKHHKEFMRDNFLTKLELEEAQIEFNNGYFYCIFNQECGEIGEGCGRECDEYKPRNGKNGRCIHSRNTYIPNGKKKIIRMKSIQEFKPIELHNLKNPE